VDALAKQWGGTSFRNHAEVWQSVPLIYVSAAVGSEAILYFCQHKASLDRPVDANGSPFKIESTIALASIIQFGTSFHASIVDNDCCSMEILRRKVRLSVVL